MPDQEPLPDDNENVIDFDECVKRLVDRVHARRNKMWRRRMLFLVAGVIIGNIAGQILGVYFCGLL